MMRYTVAATAFMMAMTVPMPGETRAQGTMPANTTTHQPVPQTGLPTARPVVVQQQRAATDAEIVAKIAEWKLLNDKGEGNFALLHRFLVNNPEWPHRIKFEGMLERAMPADWGNAKIVEWFSANTPRTKRGLDLYLTSLSNLDRTADARAAAASLFPSLSMTPSEASSLITRHKHLLPDSVINARADNRIWTKNYGEAEAMIQYMPADAAKVARARIALARNASNANALVNAVPARLENDPGLMFERARWRRKAEMLDGAYDMMRSLKVGPEYAEYAWSERHILAREYFKQKNYQRAYALAAGHEANSGTALAEGEFMAGWIALRNLNQPSKAISHFTSLYHNTKTPISRSRGAYWLGRAYEAANDPVNAENWYRNAAMHISTFYGQQAYEKLRGRMAMPPIETTASAAAHADHLATNDVARATRMLTRLGYASDIPSFLNRLMETGKDRPEILPGLAKMSHTMGRPSIGVRAAKEYHQRTGIVLLNESFPKLDFSLPSYANSALTHALIRQESIFDPAAMSHAGARGLMQLMPATAQIEARSLKIAFNLSSLTSDPAYNVRLGSYHINKLVDNNGSIIMAIAAYNAGQGNVNRWVRENGDPRTAGVDTIDWIESITFSETRNYVQRVMENQYVYSVRFNQTPQIIATQPLRVPTPAPVALPPAGAARPAPTR